MKKKFRILISTFLIFTSFISYTYAAILGPQCYQLFDKITEQWDKRKLYLIEKEHFTDFGFEAGWDMLKTGQPSLRSKNNHLIVGLINDSSLIGKVQPGDIIISVGDVDTSTVEDEDDYKFFQKLGDKEIIKFSRNGKEFELELPKLSRMKQDEQIKTSIQNISNVNIKDSTFTVKFSHSISNTAYVDSDNLEIGKVILENLIFKNEEDEWDWESCVGMKVKTFENLKIPMPGEGIFITDTTSLNKNLISAHIRIDPYAERIGDDNETEYAKITTIHEGTYKIQNDFRLQTFPFDKQILKISYRSPDIINNHELSHSWRSYGNIEHFINNSTINGWDLKNFNLNNEIYEDSTGRYYSTANIEIYIERQHGYYIYKVLIPILLILMVCWSVVWVDPRELEARLTITIVCLLSLIAYNFVIDSELPKLEYLTVMDWIILVSYFYATVPNFISVISFRVYKSNRALSDKIELYSKKFGATSYIVVILIIIAINANLFPENSSAVISLLSFR